MRGNRDKTARRLRGATVRLRDGFTLVELLVIVTIIILLLSILVPAAGTAYRAIERSISMAYIHQIGSGVEFYRNDFRDYPPSAKGANDFLPDWKGSQILVFLLTGYTDGDGKADWGFQVVHEGRTRDFGPYNGTDKLPMSTSSPRTFVDKFDNPVLYYRYDVGQSMYIAGHNDGGPADISEYARSGGRYKRSDYLLISMGADNEWRTESGADWDDITNLETE